MCGWRSTWPDTDSTDTDSTATSTSRRETGANASAGPGAYASTRTCTGARSGTCAIAAETANAGGVYGAIE